MSCIDCDSDRVCVYSAAIRKRSIVMSVSVCLSLTVPVTLSVCLFVRDDIFGTTRPICTTIFARVTYDRGSVLLWQRSDTLCISGFMNDVIFDHQPRLPDYGALVKRSAHAALGLATNCAQ